MDKGACSKHKQTTSMRTFEGVRWLGHGRQEHRRFSPVRARPGFWNQPQGSLFFFFLRTCAAKGVVLVMNKSRLRENMAPRKRFLVLRSLSLVWLPVQGDSLCLDSCRNTAIYCWTHITHLLLVLCQAHVAMCRSLPSPQPLFCN
jgi:hypothetical protein